MILFSSSAARLRIGWLLRQKKLEGLVHYSMVVSPKTSYMKARPVPSALRKFFLSNTVTNVAEATNVTGGTHIAETSDSAKDYYMDLLMLLKSCEFIFLLVDVVPHPHHL